MAFGGADNGSADNGVVAGLSKVQPARWDPNTIADATMKFQKSPPKMSEGRVIVLEWVIYRLGPSTDTSGK